MKNVVVERDQIWSYFRSVLVGQTRKVMRVEDEYVYCVDRNGIPANMTVEFLLENATLVYAPPKQEEEPEVDHTDTINRLSDMKEKLESEASRQRPSIGPWGFLKYDSWDVAYNKELDAKALEIAIAVLKSKSVPA